MNKNGQVAFESLILLLVIISASIYISGLYYQTHNTTIVYGLVRNGLTEKINSFDEVIIIESIKLERGATNKIIVKTSPSTYTNNDFDLDDLELKILQNTNFDTVQILINSS